LTQRCKNQLRAARCALGLQNGHPVQDLILRVSSERWVWLSCVQLLLLSTCRCSFSSNLERGEMVGRRGRRMGKSSTPSSHLPLVKTVGSFLFSRSSAAGRIKQTTQELPALPLGTCRPEGLCFSTARPGCVGGAVHSERACLKCRTYFSHEIFYAFLLLGWVG
jgi:hypothetical protein